MSKITMPSDEGLQELIQTEGVRYQVYDDATGKTVSSYSQVRGYPTIGVGHLIKDKERSQFSQFLGGRQKMSKNQVFRLLKHDVPRYAKPVAKRIYV
jgi:GH24 family phage-related lysozyme (muramidase)